MRKNFYLTIFLLFITTIALTQVALPYSTGFDNAGEQSGWQIHRLGATSVYNWLYNGVNAHSAPTCLVHTYPVGGSNATDDWFVSPMFNLEDGGMIDTIWHAFSGFGTPQTADTLAIYLLIGSQNPSLASERILLHDFKTGYQNDNVWRYTADIEIPEAAAHAHIAIRYRTIVNWLDIRFDDLRISGNSTVSIAPQPSLQSDIVLYPNPAQDFVFITHPKATPAQVSIFNVHGQVVNTCTLAAAMASQRIDVSMLQPGIYFIHTIVDGKAVTSKIMKE